jgi:hypothetical protein
VVLLAVVSPVGSGRRAKNIRRQVDKVGGAGVPNIEESFLPSSTRFQAGKLVKGAPLARRKDARPTLHDWFGGRKIAVLDQVDSEILEVSEGLNGSGETDKPLH